jgi:hypothetical protein
MRENVNAIATNLAMPELASIAFRSVLATLWPSASLHFSQPLRRPSSPLALSEGQTLQHEDRLGDLIALRTQISQHFVDVHFSSVL